MLHSRIKKAFFLSFLLGTLLVQMPVIHAAAPATCADNDPNCYTLLAPLPLTNPSDAGNADKTANPSTYISGIIDLTIAAAGIIAVIMIVIGGFRYVTTDSFGGKSNARESINRAIIGLFLVIGAFTILKTINPQLVNLGINIQPINKSGAINATSTCTGPTDENGDCSTLGTGAGGAGSNWFPDQNDRSAFTSISSVSVNNPNCTNIGDTGCTSLYGLNKPVILNALTKIQHDCGCGIIITGGSEFWLHGDRSTDINTNPTPHKPSGTVLDLSLSRSPELAAFLRNKGKKTTQSGCAPGDEKYVYAGALYVNEKIDGNDPHWHVCFGGY